jgi:hypothetical protein
MTKERTKVVTVTDLNRPDLDQHVQSVIGYWASEGYDYVNSHNVDKKFVLFFSLREFADIEDLGPKKELLHG